MVKTCGMVISMVKIERLPRMRLINLFVRGLLGEASPGFGGIGFLVGGGEGER